MSNNKKPNCILIRNWAVHIGHFHDLDYQTVGQVSASPRSSGLICKIQGLQLGTKLPGQIVNKLRCERLQPATRHLLSSNRFAIAQPNPFVTPVITTSDGDDFIFISTFQIKWDFFI